MAVTPDSIRKAARLLDGEIAKTPTVHASALSEMLGAQVFLKLETLQRTGSFKERGALSKLKRLEPEAARKGVIAISAGNHAQGVAYHASRLGIPTTILMPRGTPFTKIVRTRDFGARVILEGATISDARPMADEIAAREGLTFVHPYDDEEIISGQGTIAAEMLDVVPDLDTIVVPIGGGGIISGIATAAKDIRPGIEIIGVEAALFPSMYQALHGLEPTSGGDTIAEGIAVKTPGVLTQEIIARLVDDIVLADEAMLEIAVQTMAETAKVVAEGAGAAPLAALLADRDRFAGRRVGLVVCGANIDSRLLSSVLLRGMFRVGRLAKLRVEVPDQPGVLARVTREIGDSGGNIVEIVHQRMFYDVPVKLSETDILVETRDPQHVDEIIARLEGAGFRTRHLRDTVNEGN